MNCWGQISADLARFDARPWRTLLAEPQCRWLVLYRLADRSSGATRSVAAHLLRWYGRRFGLAIPLGTLGPSLRLTHGGLITINGAARIGRNCQLYQGVTIGGDYRGAPHVEDDVFIGPHVTIIGKVTVGKGAVLSAGVNIRSDVRPGAIVLPHDDASCRALTP